MGYRLALGLDVFARETTCVGIPVLHVEDVTAAAVRLRHSDHRQFPAQIRYSVYSQEIALPELAIVTISPERLFRRRH